jgi:hypothetical protein
LHVFFLNSYTIAVVKVEPANRFCMSVMDYFVMLSGHLVSAPSYLHIKCIV